MLKRARKTKRERERDKTEKKRMIKPQNIYIYINRHAEFEISSKFQCSPEGNKIRKEEIKVKTEEMDLKQKIYLSIKKN